MDKLDRDAILHVLPYIQVDLTLAMPTMLTEDQRSARELIDAKRTVNEAERTAVCAHLARLRENPATTLSTSLTASSQVLAMLRDLKTANSHLARIGYAVLAPTQPHHGSRCQAPPRTVISTRPRSSKPE